MASKSVRTEVITFPVDSSTPQQIQIPAGSGPYREITASLRSGTLAFKWYAPNTTSDYRSFPMGGEKTFRNGPYLENDILGNVQLPAGSDTLELLCER